MRSVRKNELDKKITELFQKEVVETEVAGVLIRVPIKFNFNAYVNIIKIISELEDEFPDENDFCSWESGDAILDKTKYIEAVEIWFDKWFGEVIG